MKEVVCGVDIGSWTFKVCVYDWKNFDILTNEANFRETPSLISFTQSERLIGEEAVNKMKSNFINTIRAPMRLIGLERSEELIEEELKGSTSKYDIGDELVFYITGEEKKLRVQPEELLIALMSKIRKILDSHQMQAEHFYISLPSFLSQYERRIIKKCAEVADVGKEVKVVDDWVCLASEYSYTRVKELKALASPRTVLFIDVGYSKTSMFAIQFTQSESRLLDCEHLRFVGSKNMDHLIAQFYDQQYKKNTKSTDSLFSMKKSMVKLNDHIEKQRKVLSANTDHHLNVESLIQDNDLSYNMKRSEFQDIIFPVLGEICQGFNAIKSRMPGNVEITSIQLLGGASRIPYLRTLVKESFGMEPSKTLNQSEAMAHGTAIYAAKQAALLYYEYSVNSINLVNINACWNFSQNRNFFGEVESEYKHRQVVFPAGLKVPAQNVLSFSNEGPVELFIFYGQNTSKRSIGYVRFQTPNKIRFMLDSNKIVSAKLDHPPFEVYKFHEKKEDKWIELKVKEQQLLRHEQRLRRIYEMKNDYEAKIYATKSKMEEYREIMNPVELESIGAELAGIEEWIENEHSRVLGSQEDVELYRYKLDQLQSIKVFEIFQVRRQNTSKLVVKYQAVKQAVQKASQASKNELQARKLHFLLRWLVESYEQMRETNWEGYYLTENSLDFAMDELLRISRI